MATGTSEARKASVTIPSYFLQSTKQNGTRQNTAWSLFCKAIHVYCNYQKHANIVFMGGQKGTYQYLMRIRCSWLPPGRYNQTQQNPISSEFSSRVQKP